MGVGERVRAARERLGWSQRELAEKVQMSQQGLAEIELGNSNRPRKIYELSKVLGVSLSYLALGIADKNDPFPTEEGLKAISTETPRQLSPGAIPEFDLRAGASYGGGYALQGATSDGEHTYAADVVKDEWVIPPSFLQGELRLSVKHTDVVAIDGPSMIPDLEPGDRVLIDRSHRDPRQGGIFAVREDGGVIVKHVEVVRGSDPVRIVCKSSNPTYSPFELVLDGEHVAIIGRVAGRITRM